jgi:polyisoprenoid-binding protein YceI
MKTTLLFLLAIGLSVSTATAQTDATKLTFSSDSKMWVTGTSTVHDWKCDVKDVTGSVTARVSDGVSAISAGTFSVPVENIDCDSRTMNKKVNEALNDKNTPTISFTIESATIGDQIEVTGALTLAGVTKQLVFPVTAAQAGNTLTFKGEVPVVMSNFNVDPPTAMLGTLKTGDEVKVHFEIVTNIPDAQ